MSDEKKDKIEIEEVASEELEGVSGGTCSTCGLCGGACAAPPDIATA